MSMSLHLENTMRLSLVFAQVSQKLYSVCLTDFNALLENDVTNPAIEAILIPLWLETDGRLIMPGLDILCGYLETRDRELLELFRHEKIEYDILWMHPEQALEGGAQMKVWVTIYGREAQSKSLGKVLQDVGFYLQDPVYAMRNAAYTNPQRFGNTPSIRTTDFKMISPGTMQASTTNELLQPNNVLESLTTNLSLAETHGSPYLLTELKRWFITFN
ncbi:hypothetical protein CKAH01_15641 [Colletotrichum kahawae]|uniref:Uncharacterized protein n=1 Tax=Colletotrichum kahawae TaxID=34407 RepID=A0AAE0D6L8_COLKA|nr:hypothetical protein CKAH01_15641 [Colletotrichum kahawae]